MSLQSRLLQSPAFQAFTAKVTSAVSEVCPERSDVVQALGEERRSLQSECDGYLLSLGDPKLSPAVRKALEPKYEQALDRIQEIEGQLEDAAHLAESKKAAVQPEDVASALIGLAGILDGQNAAAMNITLAQHIDRIDCFPDGKVQVRTCLLGAMAEAKDLLARYGTETSSQDCGTNGNGQIQPRRLSRRDVGMGIADEDEAEAVNNFAADPARFGDLGREWFSIDEFQEPEYHSWAATNAKAVAEYRLATHATVELTAKHFGKSSPTILSALRIARDEHGLDACGKAVSQPARVTWPIANAQAVVDFLNEPGRLLKDAVQHFQKSEPTIRLARQLGLSQRGGQ